MSAREQSQVGTEPPLDRISFFSCSCLGPSVEPPAVLRPSIGVTRGDAKTSGSLRTRYLNRGSAGTPFGPGRSSGGRDSKYLVIFRSFQTPMYVSGLLRSLTAHGRQGESLSSTLPPFLSPGPYASFRSYHVHLLFCLDQTETSFCCSFHLVMVPYYVHCYYGG